MSFFKKIRSTLSNRRRAERGVLNPVYRNDGNEDVDFTSIDQTRLKTSFPSDNPQPGPSTEVPQYALQSEKQQPRTSFSWLKFSLFTILILGSITVSVIVITALRDPTPPIPPAPVCTSKVEIPLMDNPVINCDLNHYKSDKLTIVVTAPKVGSTPEYLTFESSVGNRTWTMNQSSELSVQIWGPKMQCNSYGTYQINFMVPGKDVKTQNVTIAMSSILPRANLTLDRASSCTADGKYTDYFVSCATWSGCNINSLNLMPIAENGSVSDFELPFKCKTKYTHVQGWYVNCSGRIDEALANTITEIKCYQSSGLPESKVLKPCNLTDRCTGIQTRLGENISIICNFSSDLWKNISISVYYQSSSNEMVLLPKEALSGWATNYTPDKGRRNFTLTGPQANCSSAGKYLIKITDTNTNKSRSQNVTVEIKGNAYLRATNTSNSSATCESDTDCDINYTLRIEPYYTSLTTNISQNCDTQYSDSDGWITTCGIKPLNGYNVSGKCTLSDNNDVEPDQTVLLLR